MATFSPDRLNQPKYHQSVTPQSLWKHLPIGQTPDLLKVILSSILLRINGNKNSEKLYREIELRHLKSHSYLCFSACAQQTNSMRQQHRHHPLHRHRHQEPSRRHPGQVDDEHVYLTYDVVQFPHIKHEGAVEPLTQEPRVEQNEIRDSQRGEEQGHGPAGPPSRHRAQDDQGHAVPERSQEQDDGRADLPQGHGHLIRCQRLLGHCAVFGDGVFGSVLWVGVDRGLERDVEGSHDQFHDHLTPTMEHLWWTLREIPLMIDYAD